MDIQHIATVEIDGVEVDIEKYNRNKTERLTAYAEGVRQMDKKA